MCCNKGVILLAGAGLSKNPFLLKNVLVTCSIDASLCVQVLQNDHHTRDKPHLPGTTNDFEYKIENNDNSKQVVS
jgi:hypothetical protein